MRILRSRSSVVTLRRRVEVPRNPAKESFSKIVPVPGSVLWFTRKYTDVNDGAGELLFELDSSVYGILWRN